MKESYFQYGLIVLVIILALMLFMAVSYVGHVNIQNETLKKENQELRELVDGISEEIRVLSDRIEEIIRDVNDSEDWNRETH